jgi:uncharacterized membrane protein YjjP (DUF1212 family)
MLLHTILARAPTSAAVCAGTNLRGATGVGDPQREIGTVDAVFAVAAVTIVGVLTLSVPSAAAAPPDGAAVVEPTTATLPPDPVPANPPAPDPNRAVTTEPGATEPATSEPDTSAPESPPTTSLDVQDTPDDTAVDAVPTRPGAPPSVQSSDIPVGSIVLAVFVLAAVGLASYVLARRRPVIAESEDDSTQLAQEVPVADAVVPPRRVGDAAMMDFLIGLGRALIDAGDSVRNVESTLRAVARVNGLDGIGVIVLPTALMVSVPGADDVVTEVSVAGRAPLRLDQVDDLLTLVHEAEGGAIGSTEGQRRLEQIRSSSSPYSHRTAVVGYILLTVGLAAILRAPALELAVAAVLGAVVGSFRLSTRRLSSSHQPFVPLIAAAAVSTSVYSLGRVVSDLETFPLLVAPLITFLPGALLTIGVLELATGQNVSGTSRLAAGALQLVLLSLGLVAGSELVGVPSGDLGSSIGGPVGVFVPWLGVAVFGIGVVWFNGAKSSARVWIVMVLYVAYSGQVIGGLFFGSALSSFFGALAMTPVAVLAARQRSGPTPLVMFLPGFWILVPGALGLDGVTRILGAGPGNGTGALITTMSSMIGISLGILLGLVLVASDPERPWAQARAATSDSGTPDQRVTRW